MQIVFVNRFFHPDHSATSQHLSDLAWHLARHGAEVSVITSRQRIDHPRAMLPARERNHGVQVHRVWGTCFGRQRLPGRVMDYLSFYVMSTFALLRLVRRGDAVVACTDPPLICVPAGWVAAARGARLVNWLHDLFPEVAERLGVLSRGPSRLLRWLRDGSLHRACCNVAIGEVMAKKVAGLGVPGDRIAVIHNWCDPVAVAPLAPEDNRLRHEWGLDGRFVVCYSGNLGRAHEFDGLLGAARMLVEEPRVVFLFIGAGAQADVLRHRAAELHNVVFLPPQPRRDLCHSLGVADVHVVSLRPALEGLVVPSKFYGVAAAGRPSLFLGERGGEVARIIEREACGVVCDGLDASAIATAIRELATAPARARAMGQRARGMLEQHYAQPLAMARWREVLDVV